MLLVVLCIRSNRLAKHLFSQSLHSLTFLTASHNSKGIIYNHAAQRSEKQLLFIYCEYIVVVFYLDSLQFVLIIWLTTNSHVKYLDKEEVHPRRRLLRPPSSSHFESLNIISVPQIFFRQHNDQHNGKSQEFLLSTFRLYCFST